LGPTGTKIPSSGTGKRLLVGEEIELSVVEKKGKNRKSPKGGASHEKAKKRE